MIGDGLTASIHIAAAPERVFEYVTRSEAMVRWMGEHAALDPRVGGAFNVDIPARRAPWRCG